MSLIIAAVIIIKMLLMYGAWTIYKQKKQISSLLAEKDLLLEPYKKDRQVIGEMIYWVRKYQEAKLVTVASDVLYDYNEDTGEYNRHNFIVPNNHLNPGIVDNLNKLIDVYEQDHYDYQGEIDKIRNEYILLQNKYEDVLLVYDAYISDMINWKTKYYEEK